MKSAKWLAVALVLVAAPMTAQAQDAMDGGGSGGHGVAAMKKSLSFGIPNGGNGYVNGAAGVWMMMMENLNLGINFGLAFGNKPETNFDVLVGPAVRYYLDVAGPVLPFVAGQMNFRFYDDGVTGNDDDPELSLAGGLGAEWFVTDIFSIAGHVGLGLDLLRAGGSDAGIRAGTFTSGMTAQLYFE